MRQQYEQLQGFGVEALCISFEPPEVLIKLAQELDLPFSILCDTERKVYEAYGITQTKTAGGFVVD